MSLGLLGSQRKLLSIFPDYCAAAKIRGGRTQCQNRSAFSQSHWGSSRQFWSFLQTSDAMSLVFSLRQVCGHVPLSSSEMFQKNWMSWKWLFFV